MPILSRWLPKQVPRLAVLESYLSLDSAAPSVANLLGGSITSVSSSVCKVLVAFSSKSSVLTSSR